MKIFGVTYPPDPIGATAIYIYIYIHTHTHTHTGPALGDVRPNREQFRSAQVPSQLAPRSVDLGAGPIGSNWSNWLNADPVYIFIYLFVYLFIYLRLCLLVSLFKI